MTSETREMMTTDQAAAYLSVRSQLLVQWRHTRTGPQYHRLGRLVRYDRALLDAYLKDVTVAPRS